MVTSSGGASEGLRIPGGLLPLLLACFLAALSGCASVPHPEHDPPDTLEPEVRQEPQDIPEEATEPAHTPSPGISTDEPSHRFAAKAAIVLSDRSAAFEGVASELGYLLNEPLIYNLADKSQTPAEAFAGIANSGAQVVIAIGFSATSAAVRWSTVPVIYCQVFNPVPEDRGGVAVRGVAAIPPLAIQLAAWKRLDPDLQSIGAILGEGHQDLVAEAAVAAKTHGVAFHYETAGSDRETLYLFNRMAPNIDGFWLFPDNRVLSVPVLRKIVSIAARHYVRIAVFNEALLELGFTLSTAPAESDIAATILAVAAEVASGDSETVPGRMPLHEVKVRTASVADPRADSVRKPASAGGGGGRL